jgi:hypothetical protein
MVWLSGNVYDPSKVNFVDQQVPLQLAQTIRAQKKPPLTKSQIANDPTHAHYAKAASQLSDEAAIYLLTGMLLGFKADADGDTNYPPMQHTEFELLTQSTAGSIAD